MCLMVVQIRNLVAFDTTLKLVKTPLLLEGGVPVGRGGFYNFVESEFLHKPPRLFASLAATPPWQAGSFFTASQLHRNSYLHKH